MKKILIVIFFGFYILGNAQDNTIYYWENGSKKSEGNLINDKEEGLWTYYYTNGQKAMQGNFAQGQKIGQWQAWYKSGKLQSEYYPQTGILKSWYESGEKESIGYHAGSCYEPVSVWSLW